MSELIFFLTARTGLVSSVNRFLIHDQLYPTRLFWGHARIEDQESHAKSQELTELQRNILEVTERRQVEWSALMQLMEAIQLEESYEGKKKK